MLFSVVCVFLSVVCVFSAYNDKVVAFLRQPNFAEIMKAKHNLFSSNIPLKSKIHLIRSEEGGVEALERLSNDVELILFLRLSS